MSSSTSSSRWSARRFGPALTTLALLAVGLGAWILAVGPRLPVDARRTDHIGGEPWWADEERLPYQAARDPARAELLFLGNSRVDRAIVDRVFEQAGLGTTVVLWGQGGQLLDLLPLARRRFTPRRAVVALCPLSIHAEVHPEAVEAFRRQLGERQARRWTSERVDSFLDGRLRMLRDRSLPTVDPAAWHEAWSEPLRPTIVPWLQRRLRPATRAERDLRAEGVVEELRALREAGWSVLCLRLPVHPLVRSAEERAFPGGRLRALCERAGVAYLDHSREPYGTFDGHHMAHGDARRYSARLARELAAHFESMVALEPASARRRLRTASDDRAGEAGH